MSDVSKNKPISPFYTVFFLGLIYALYAVGDYRLQLKEAKAQEPCTCPEPVPCPPEGFELTPLEPPAAPPPQPQQSAQEALEAIQAVKGSF